MAKFGIAGDTSGVITVQGPAIAGSNTLTWPAETGTVITTATTSGVPNTIQWNTTVQTTGFTAVAYGGYFCNTTGGAFTVTLPATPTRGQFVVIVDYAGTSATNNITVNPNGSYINGESNAVLATNRQGITFTYIDSTQGWLASSNVYGGSTPFTQPYAASYLVVAGGGGGGSGIDTGRSGGGGGAGGLLASTAYLTVGAVYTITVGGGGAGAVGNGYDNGISGSNSVLSGSGITTQTAIGGGYGGTGYTSADRAGGSGGSGGGGQNAIGGSGTPGQGNDGGNNSGIGSGAGGGGAGAVGGSGSPSNNGGNGTASSITGSSITYAGGGAGSGGTGGSGGGGNGGSGSAVPALNGTAGTTNLGAGGGGGKTSYPTYPGTAGNGGNGGSGVVILSVPTAKYTGTTTGSPTVTTSGSNTILKYTASGTYTA